MLFKYNKTLDEKNPLVLGDVQLHFGEAALPRSLEHGQLTLALRTSTLLPVEGEIGELVLSLPSVYLVRHFSVEMPFGPRYREACRYLCKVKSEIASIPSSKIYRKQIYFFNVREIFFLKVKWKP